MITKYVSTNKSQRCIDLVNCIKHCDLCDRPYKKYINLSLLKGNVNSKVFIIDEYPDPDQNEEYGNLEMLLNNVGWKKEDVFVAYALLCNSFAGTDISSMQLRSELDNCTLLLQMLINLVNPEVIVTLGEIALEALNIINSHDLNLRDNAGMKISWSNKTVIPLYSPNKGAKPHRSILKQRSDIISVAKFVDPFTGIKRKKYIDNARNTFKSYSQNVLNITIHYVMSLLNEVSYFKLIKLMYFIDLTALERLGHTLTGALYLRQQEGPWSPDLKKAIDEMSKYELELSNKNEMLSVKVRSPFQMCSLIDETYQKIINEVVTIYGNMDNTAIKIAAYRSKPMQYVLRQEGLKRNIRKIPLIYKDKTIIDLDNK